MHSFPFQVMILNWWTNIFRNKVLHISQSDPKAESIFYDLIPIIEILLNVDNLNAYSFIIYGWQITSSLGSLIENCNKVENM